MGTDCRGWQHRATLQAALRGAGDIQRAREKSVQVPTARLFNHEKRPKVSYP